MSLRLAQETSFGAKPVDNVAGRHSPHRARSPRLEGQPGLRDAAQTPRADQGFRPRVLQRRFFSSTPASTRRSVGPQESGVNLIKLVFLSSKSPKMLERLSLA